MKRTVSVALILIAAGLLSGGCATSAMKGTPFFTGEYEKRIGAPEERVNVWPLVYYRDPALSVLWPLMELTDEHLAVRPVMSIHGLDEEKRIYNFLWPIGQVNQKTGDHRFFPAFWGKDYFNVFPLYWHYGGGPKKVDSLFPAWVLFRNDEKYSYHFAWPVVNFKDWGKRSGWRVWPVAGSYKNYGDRYSFYAWPLGHVWADGTETGSALIPLYWYDADANSKTFVSLPYSFSRGGGRDWDCAFPLYYREKSDSRSSFISPLYMRGQDVKRDTDWSCLVPLYFSGRQGQNEVFGTLAGGWARRGDQRGWAAVPALSWGAYSQDKGYFVAAAGLGHRSWNGDNGSSHVLPFYYRSRTADSKLFVSLPYSSGKTQDGSWKLVPPLYFASENERMKTFVTPLYARSKALQDDAYWSALMPLYYRDGDAESKRLITIVGAWAEDGDSKSWVVYPLLSGSRRQGESGETWLGGPLFHRKWDKDGSLHHVFPLYYKNSKEGAFASLPYASWNAGDGRTTRLIPPLLSAMTSGDNRNDLWGLGGLVHASWGEGETPHHLLPFYYSDPAKGRFLSLPYCSKKRDDYVKRIVPPLLSGYSRYKDDRELTVLAGLSRHEWDDEGSSGYTLPLYSYGKDYFHTPLFGWNKKKPSGYVYPLTPFVGLRTGEDKGGWIFPLFSYRKDSKERVRGTYLWGGFWKNKRSSGSSIFPIYSYQNHGSIEELPEKPKAYRSAGKEFVSLPFCWYKNKVYTYPVYKEGKRTEGVRLSAQKGNGFFPLWSYKANKDLESGRVDSGGALLLWLFDSKYEKRPERGHEYVRKRVLWRLYHYERLNEDVSVDVFPFITYDRREDGSKSFSFLWRLFSYRKKEDGLKVHVLFIPFGKGK